MPALKHLRPISQSPEHAQLGSFQIKLEFTTAVFDTLLLADRWRLYKVVPGDGTDTTDDIGGGEDVPNVPL